MTKHLPSLMTPHLWRRLAGARSAVRAGLGLVMAPLREYLVPHPTPVASGLYRTTAAHPAITFADGARRHKRSTQTINLTRVTTKAALLTELSRRLDFPDYFGHNWDALDECLRELAYLPGPGYVLLFTHGDRLAAAEPATWQMLLKVLAHATAEPTPPTRTLVMIIIDPTGVAPNLPLLPGT